MQQEAHVIRRTHRLHLAAQPLDGVTVDPRQQTALAPLLAPIDHAPKTSPDDEALLLERDEGLIDGLRRGAKRRSEGGRVNR